MSTGYASVPFGLITFSSKGKDLSVQCSVESGIKEIIHTVSELMNGSAGPIKMFFDGDTSILEVSRKDSYVFIKESGLLGYEISMDIDKFYEYAMRIAIDMMELYKKRGFAENNILFERQKDDVRNILTELSDLGIN